MWEVEAPKLAERMMVDDNGYITAETSMGHFVIAQLTNPFDSAQSRDAHRVDHQLALVNRYNRWHDARIAFNEWIKNKKGGDEHDDRLREKLGKLLHDES